MKLTKEECKAILTTAVEQGSAYWFEDHMVLVSRDLTDNMLVNRVKVDETEAEAGDIQKALEELFNTVSFAFPKVKADIAANRSGCDAEAADVLLQFAIFGEVIYA